MKNIIIGSVFVFIALLAQKLFAEEDFDMRHSYAVVWTVNSGTSELYSNTLADQASSVLELWKAGAVENVYLDNKVSVKEIDKGDSSRVVFFIKAETEADAKKMLDAMPFVNEKVATYELFPVGILWLKQY